MKLREKMYSADGTISASSREELEMMRGERREDGSYTGYVAEILETCGMAPKYIAIAGEKGQVEEEMLGGAMLGVGYVCSSDNIAFSFPQPSTEKAEGDRRKRSASPGKNGSGSLLLRTTLFYIMG